nr:uncharacterized protein LOC127303182 [Lolium perenne]
MAAPADAPLRLPHLPADIFMEILSRVGDAVAVVRCAATCKAWRRLILEPSFPSPLLGFFFRDTSPKRPHRRRYLGRPTRFLLIGRPHSVFHLSHFLPNAASLSGFDAVASGGHGLIALRRVKGYSCDSIRICVCNPMAGTSTFLPPLPVPDISFLESLAFLDADGSSFRLLASTKRYPDAHAPDEMLLRVFSSQTGQWGMAVTAQLPDNMAVYLRFPAVVHHGDIHWICYNHRFAVDAVLAVRLGQTEASARRIDLPLHAGINRRNEGALRLFSSALGCLSLVYVDNKPVISIWNFQDDGTWALHKTAVTTGKSGTAVQPNFAVSCCTAKISLPCVAGRAHGNEKMHGKVLAQRTAKKHITAKKDMAHGKEVSHGKELEKRTAKILGRQSLAVVSGLFMVNLETGMTSKVCDAFCDKYECPYMPDLRSCLGAMKSF